MSNELKFIKINESKYSFTDTYLKTLDEVLDTFGYEVEFHEIHINLKGTWSGSDNDKHYISIDEFNEGWIHTLEEASEDEGIDYSEWIEVLKKKNPKNLNIWVEGKQFKDYIYDNNVDIGEDIIFTFNGVKFNTNIVRISLLDKGQASLEFLSCYDVADIVKQFEEYGENRWDELDSFTYADDEGEIIIEGYDFNEFKEFLIEEVRKYEEKKSVKVEEVKMNKTVRVALRNTIERFGAVSFVVNSLESFGCKVDNAWVVNDECGVDLVNKCSFEDKEFKIKNINSDITGEDVWMDVVLEDEQIVATDLSNFKENVFELFEDKFEKIMTQHEIFQEDLINISRELYNNLCEDENELLSCCKFIDKFSMQYSDYIEEGSFDEREQAKIKEIVEYLKENDTDDCEVLLETLLKHENIDDIHTIITEDRGMIGSFYDFENRLRLDVPYWMSIDEDRLLKMYCEYYGYEYYETDYCELHIIVKTTI